MSDLFIKSYFWILVSYSISFNTICVPDAGWTQWWTAPPATQTTPPQRETPVCLTSPRTVLVLSLTFWTPSLWRSWRGCRGAFTPWYRLPQRQLWSMNSIVTTQAHQYWRKALIRLVHKHPYLSHRWRSIFFYVIVSNWCIFHFDCHL